MDQLCINTVRTLAMDAVQQARSGHPGTALAMAPVIVVEQRGLIVDYQRERLRIDQLCQDDLEMRIHPPQNRYAPAYCALVAVLEPTLVHHRIVAYHCTRLTESEIEPSPDFDLYTRKAVAAADVLKIIEFSDQALERKECHWRREWFVLCTSSELCARPPRARAHPRVDSSWRATAQQVAYLLSVARAPDSPQRLPGCYFPWRSLLLEQAADVSCGS